MIEPSKKSYKIGLLDSSSGGLSILKALEGKIPHASYEYLCDNLFFPYGELENPLLLKRALEIAEKFCKARKLDLLVIACNTASTVVLAELRKKVSIPIVGVVPAIKTAAKLSKTGTIGIVATRRTIESSYLENLIKNFAPSFLVLKKISPKLVSLSDGKINGKKPNISMIKSELQDFLSHESLDTVVLGCTHYSQLIPEIKSLDHKNLNWIDSSEAIAKRTKSLLPQNLVLNDGERSTTKIFYTKQKSFSEASWKSFLPEASFHLFIP